MLSKTVVRRELIQTTLSMLHLDFGEGEGRLRNRGRRNVKIIPGPNRRNKQPKGLARVAFEVEAHCSRSEGFLPRAGNVT